MAQFVYIDETGSASQQPFLTLVAVLVDEDKVRDLSAAMRRVAWQHLGWYPAGFEFHGHDVWSGTGWWADKAPPELIAAYESALTVLDELELEIAHSTIDKARLHARYNGSADRNAYRLALQFLLEKIDRVGTSNKVLVADEAKEQELNAVKMVADLQQWGAGEVPGKTLTTIIDCLHFVRSNASPGVQLADLVAYVIQRARRNAETHPDAQAALHRFRDVVTRRVVTWRESWP